MHTSLFDQRGVEQSCIVERPSKPIYGRILLAVCLVALSSTGADALHLETGPLSAGFTWGSGSVRNKELPVGLGHRKEAIEPDPLPGECRAGPGFD